MRNRSIKSLAILLIVILGTASVPIQDSKIKLLVSVIDNRGNNVEGATISIYSSSADYQNSENRLVKGKTDKKGKFQFKGLESRSYFIDVRKDNLKNDGQGVQTGLLSEGKLNKVIVIIK